MKNSKIIIAIDGHSSCGKSTLAKQLAACLEYNYIDTGAMYRAVTLYALRHMLIADAKVNASKLIEHLDDIRIGFVFNPSTQNSDTHLNDENVESEIRRMQVSENVSHVATIKEVREAMVQQQQAMGKERGIVMDGRDIGSVVFPEAELKIFLTASAQVRAQRRYDELKEKGENVSFENILKNVEERDYIDSNRAESPLIKARDAFVIDNSTLTREEQLQLVLDKVEFILTKKNTCNDN